MKLLPAILVLFAGLNATAATHNWYRIYLASKCYVPAKFQQYYFAAPACGVPVTYLPPWQRPKGAVFCRMEDYLTAKTGIWIKVGVK